VLVGATPDSRRSLIAAATGVSDWSWWAASLPMFAEFRYGATPRVRAWAPPGTVAALAGQRPPRRVVAHHPALLLEYVTLIDTPGLAGHGPGLEILMDAMDRAAAVLFVVDALPLPPLDLDLVREARSVTDSMVFSVADQPGRRPAEAWLRDELAERAPPVCPKPRACLGRT
jgi:hypothetical protein